MRRFQVVRSARAVRSWALLAAFLIISFLAAPFSATHAAISVTGNVSPEDPSTWNCSTNCYVGKTADGTLNVQNDGFSVYYCYIGDEKAATGRVTIDGSLASGSASAALIGWGGKGILDVLNGGYFHDCWGYVGYKSGSTGIVTVDGTGSTWHNSNDLYVSGSHNTGTLNITNGGIVTVGNTTTISCESTATGLVNFGSNGGSLTTKTLYASYLQLAGTGTINTNGFVGDVDLLFDKDHGLKQTFTIEKLSDQHITVNLDMTQSITADIGLGWKANASMVIRDAVVVYSGSGYLGYQAGSTGAATVKGSGSRWINVSDLYVGRYGTGQLNITDGGAVSASGATYIGYGAGSKGTATVDGKDSTWTSGSLHIGELGSATLNITDGATVSVDDCYISSGSVLVSGANSKLTSENYLQFDGANGVLIIKEGGKVSGRTFDLQGHATVDGSGSRWTNNSFLCIGGGGLTSEASLTITNGGAVTSSSCAIGHDQSAYVTVKGADSTLTCTTVVVGSTNAGSPVSGSLNISNGAVVTDTDGYIGSQSGSTAFVTVDGLGSKWTNSSSLDVGHYTDNGILKITNGATVSSGSDSIVGSSKIGTVAVDGDLSTLSVGGNLIAGDYGRAFLDVTNGGVVTSAGGYLGKSYATATGTVTVDGPGSKWLNSGSLVIGESGSGTLNITNGGAVTATSVSINSTSLLAMDAGNGSSLTVSGGSGTITNNGTIRISAGANIEAGIYKPILAGAWGGSGKVQAFGGAWDSIAHTFTAAAAQSGNAGETLVVNSQRLLIEGSNGQSVAVNFLADATPSTFKASVIDINTLNSLEGSLAVGQSVLSGWLFEPGDGYTEGNAVCLSLEIGAGQSLDNLGVWHFDGSTWSPYTVTDLTYDGTYANFTVTGFSGYAMSGITVPEPGAIVLLAVGLASLLAYAWRKKM